MSANLSAIQFPVYVIHFWNRLAEKCAAECGEVCPNMIDSEKYFSLKTEKEKDIYLRTSCVMECNIFSSIPFDRSNVCVEIVSRPYLSPPFTATTCNKKFPRTQKLVEQQFLLFQEKIYGKK